MKEIKLKQIKVSEHHLSICFLHFQTHLLMVEQVPSHMVLMNP